MKLGSLFDGSGTAPLAASMCGIEPVWASEIEPYPIAVTKARFPNMKHLGSILDIKGGEIEPVDIICGGSPCQDLSVAGAQKGLIEGERSNLFFEMIRIIKEMRSATNGKSPRWVIWENVPGAFSSNKGKDFLEVLRQYSALADPNVYVPEPQGKNGKLAWGYAGSIVGDEWSLAWRTVDLQYWGISKRRIPQRRRRVYLILDLGSKCAGKILFERPRLLGNYEKGRKAWKGAPADAEGSSGGSCTDGRAKVLNVLASTAENERDDKRRVFTDINGKGRYGGNQLPIITCCSQKIDCTVQSFGHDERNTQFTKDGACDSLTASDYKQPIVVAYGLESI